MLDMGRFYESYMGETNERQATSANFYKVICDSPRPNYNILYKTCNNKIVAEQGQLISSIYNEWSRWDGLLINSHVEPNKGSHDVKIAIVCTLTQ